MAGTSGQEQGVQPNSIPLGGFAEPQHGDQQGALSAVGFVVLGFGFMGAFTTLGLVLGTGVLSALIIAWIGSIAAILFVAVLVVWRQSMDERDNSPGIETILEWQADLVSDRRSAEQIGHWDVDLQNDSAVEAVQSGKRRA